MSGQADRAILSRLVVDYDRILEDSLGLGDPEFHYFPDPNGSPGEVVVVDPAEPGDVDDPTVLNLDKG